ncbi:hypothetical protein B0H14DRAFT_2638142 [Mycena olivaceomarginata]|nr:hypothetical protein B0H14DRAFT_2638142 [Mycena olivaceomarginata]
MACLYYVHFKVETKGKGIYPWEPDAQNSHLRRNNHSAKPGSEKDPDPKKSTLSRLQSSVELQAVSLPISPAGGVSHAVGPWDCMREASLSNSEFGQIRPHQPLLSVDQFVVDAGEATVALGDAVFMGGYYSVDEWNEHTTKEGEKNGKERRVARSGVAGGGARPGLEAGKRQEGVPLVEWGAEEEVIDAPRTMRASRVPNVFKPSSKKPNKLGIDGAHTSRCLWCCQAGGSRVFEQRFLGEITHG